jgi:glycosyltransferase involved in cell wall biosynthesis
MRFSVITPTFNRRLIVGRSIDSSLMFARAVGRCEVIVVDDASQDGTADVIRDRYAKELATGILKLVELRQNRGSAAAKAEGGRHASGDWLVFLDSDDEMLPEACVSLPAFATSHDAAPVLLFRCVDQTGGLIGPPAPPAALSFQYLLTQGTPGECLPVISRMRFLENLPENDIQSHEFIATLRIIRAHGPAMLSDAVARRYHTEGEDRLTSRAGNLRRARQHAEGFRRMLREFGSLMPLRQRAGLYLRVFCYSAAAAFGLGRQPRT